MEDIEVPSFFVCPISMEIMKDPVIVPTGITYDRTSIEKWLFSGKNNTCPVTKQIISSDCEELIPNHTLRRLIQSWCTLNASYGIERIQTPKPPVNKTQITKLINDAKAPLQQIKCLRKLRSIADENDTNKRCMESSGVVEFLVSIVNKFNSVNLEESTSEDYGTFEVTRPSDEALSLLYNLKLSESSLKKLNGHQFIESLTQIMQLGNYESRAYAVFLLRLMIEVSDPMPLINLKPEIFQEIVQVLRDQISHKATKATLQVLINVCPWGRNRIKAIEAGAVSILIDLLLESTERRPCEMMLTVLDLLCQCAEGRSELLRHGAGLAVVSKKILRVSQVASDRGVRILSSISRSSASPSVVQEMLQLGVVTKLCLVIQVDCRSKTKERAGEILKLHARVWKNSTCIPLNLLSSYPA